MGRRKIDIKRIEHPKHRNVTFCKRRRGLMKKAQELAILCDVNLGMVVFSSRGKMFQYCSPSTSMKQIIDRYTGGLPIHQREGDASSSRSLLDTYAGSSWANEQVYRVHEDQMTREMASLKSEMEMLQASIRHLMGEDLETLSMNNLNQLEQQIEAAMHRVRSWKEVSAFFSSGQAQTPFTSAAAVDYNSLEPQMQADLLSAAPTSVENSFESQMQLGHFAYEHDRYRDFPREQSPFEFQNTYHFWM
ncbi:MADS-box protein [Nymphaea thermarum]|nr:MADS-box protein [Nymphaea thermarum]